MNNVILTGRIVGEPQIKQTQSGKAFCGFSLAVDRELSKQKREEADREGRPTADFPRCQAWGMTAELIGQYCSKGSKIGVIGRLQTGSYDKDGRTVYTTDVVVDRIEFLDSASYNLGNDDFTEVDSDSSIPF